MVFHGNFSGHEALFGASALSFAQGGGSHSGGDADFGLAAAHRGGDGGAFFEYTAYFARYEQESDDIVRAGFGFGEAQIVHQDSRDNASGTIRRSGNYSSKIGIFLIDGQGEATDPFDELREAKGFLADGVVPALRIGIGCVGQ